MRRSLMTGLAAVLLATGGLAGSAPTASAGRATTPVTLVCDGDTEFYAPAGTIIEFSWDANCTSGDYNNNVNQIWNVSTTDGTANGFLTAPKSIYTTDCYGLCTSAYTPGDWYFLALDGTIQVKLLKSRKMNRVTTDLVAGARVAGIALTRDPIVDHWVIWKGTTAP